MNHEKYQAPECRVSSVQTGSMLCISSVSSDSDHEGFDDVDDPLSSVQLF